MFLGEDGEVMDDARVGTEQEWGLALLFSVEPTDRALYGHALAVGPGMAIWLQRLADPDRADR